MRSVNQCVRTATIGLVAIAGGILAGTTAQAGGALYVVPVNGKLEPVRWNSEIRTYTDLSDLGSLPNAKARELVQFSLDQWSSVPTSTLRASVAGTFADLGLGDIDGTNAGEVVGTYNGGGLHVIFDNDGSVIQDFFGAGYGVLGIASPEWLADDSATVLEAWAVINAQPSWIDEPEGGPVKGVITHEFGHAFGLAHTQLNGWYAMNAPNDWSSGGAEQAGPDQCGKVGEGWPAPSQVETMYPMIDPYPWSPSYNSPDMATVEHADDVSALSTLYPAAGFAAQTGTITGRVVAKDGTSELTGINVIARSVADPFDGVSSISGEATQGLLGPDGRFRITGLKPGVQYRVYIDELAQGAFSTPKAILLAPEEYWNSSESADASVDNACESTPIVLAAGQTKQIEIAANGIPRAPTFTHLPYLLPLEVSANGQRIVGLYGPQYSPYWIWDKRTGEKYIGGEGFTGAISRNGQVVGGTMGFPKQMPWGVMPVEKAALWTAAKGWTVIGKDEWEGCDVSHSSVWDVSNDGSAAVGLAWKDCRDVSPFLWTAQHGMTLLGKTGERPARPNAMSGDGRVVGGWDEPEFLWGARAGSIWINGEQMLLMDPDGAGLDGYVGEVQAINSAGTVAVGINAGPVTPEGTVVDTYKWTPTGGVTNIGRYPGQICYSYYDWWTWELVETCDQRIGGVNSISDDGKVIVGQSDLPMMGVRDATIYTPGMGWMLLGEFLERNGVLEASRWVMLHAEISGNGKTLVGTGFPLAADYWQGFRLELDQVFVCHGNGKAATTLRVGFPDSMDTHLGHGDRVGFCEGEGPL